MLAKLVGDTELASVGLVDPFAEHKVRPLLEHLEDFARYLAAKGHTQGHVEKTVARCRALIEGCAFAHTTDLQPSAVLEFLAGLRKGGEPLDPGKDWYTVAEVAALCGIRPASVCRMAKRDLLARQGAGRKQRFALLAARGRGIGIQTSNHYLAAVRAFSKWLVKDGRAAVDLLAHLSRQNADVDVRHPRRALREEMIRQYTEGSPRHKPLWPGTWTEAGAEMIRLDLQAAGIPYQDDDGRYFDFHALLGLGRVRGPSRLCRGEDGGV